MRKITIKNRKTDQKYDNVSLKWRELIQNIKKISGIFGLILLIVLASGCTSGIDFEMPDIFSSKEKKTESVSAPQKQNKSDRTDSKEKEKKDREVSTVKSDRSIYPHLIVKNKNKNKNVDKEKIQKSTKSDKSSSIDSSMAGIPKKELLKNANELYQAGKYSEASKFYLSWLNQCEESTPNEMKAQVCSRLGNIAMKRRQLPTAEDYYLKAVQLTNGQNPEYLFATAEILFEQEKYAEAEQYFLNITQKAPELTAAGKYYGLCLLKQGRPECLKPLAAAMGEVRACHLIAENFYDMNRPDLAAQMEAQMQDAAAREGVTPPLVRNKPINPEVERQTQADLQAKRDVLFPKQKTATADSLAQAALEDDSNFAFAVSGKVNPTTTVAAPVQTTVNPATTAVAPVQTTVNPVTTAVAPVQTTVNPATTAVAPVQTTVNPVTTAVAPVQTTVNPATTAVAPVQTTVNPVTTAVAPVQTTVNPVTTVAAPVQTTVNPVTTVAAPVQTTVNPVTTAAAPVQTTVNPAQTPSIAAQNPIPIQKMAPLLRSAASVPTLSKPQLQASAPTFPTVNQLPGSSSTSKPSAQPQSTSTLAGLATPSSVPLSAVNKTPAPVVNTTVAPQKANSMTLPTLATVNSPLMNSLAANSKITLPTASPAGQVTKNVNSATPAGAPTAPLTQGTATATPKTVPTVAALLPATQSVMTIQRPVATSAPVSDSLNLEAIQATEDDRLIYDPNESPLPIRLVSRQGQEYASLLALFAESNSRAVKTAVNTANISVANTVSSTQKTENGNSAALPNQSMETIEQQEKATTSNGSENFAQMTMSFLDVDTFKMTLNPDNTAAAPKTTVPASRNMQTNSLNENVRSGFAQSRSFVNQPETTNVVPWTNEDRQLLSAEEQLRILQPLKSVHSSRTIPKISLLNPLRGLLQK